MVQRKALWRGDFYLRPEVGGISLECERETDRQRQRLCGRWELKKAGVENFFKDRKQCVMILMLQLLESSLVRTIKVCDGRSMVERERRKEREGRWEMNGE